MNATKFILLMLFIALPVFVIGCASTGMYMNPNDCRLDSTGAFYTCYYVKDGQVMTYRKSFNHRAQKEKSK